MDLKFGARFLFDAVVIYSISHFGVYIERHWQPPERGFMCDDVTSISFPYQENTISPKNVVISSIVIPIITMVCVDLLVFRRSLGVLYDNIAAFMLGSALVYLSGNITKYQLGVLRPYFLSVCKPKHANLTCAEGYMSAEEIACSGDFKAIQQARLSFPSLHASMTSFGTVFLLAHLNQCGQTREGHIYRTFKIIVGSAYVTWLVIVVTSRLTDYWHHLNDVIFGTLWGTSFAILSILQMSAMIFSKPKPSTFKAEVQKSD